MQNHYTGKKKSQLYIVWIQNTFRLFSLTTHKASIGNKQIS